MSKQSLVDIMSAYRAKLEDPSSADDLALGLGFLMKTQQRVSIAVKGAIPAEYDDVTKDALRTYFLATIVELAELIQTMDWKPWKDKAAMLDGEKTPDEFADVLAFIGVILANLYALGLTPGDLANAYRRKSIVNIDRFLGAHGEEYRRV